MTSQTPLLHTTMSPIGLAYLEIPNRHEALLSLLLPACHLPGNIQPPSPPDGVSQPRTESIYQSPLESILHKRYNSRLSKWWRHPEPLTIFSVSWSGIWTYDVSNSTLARYHFANRAKIPGRQEALLLPAGHLPGSNEMVQELSLRVQWMLFIFQTTAQPNVANNWERGGFRSKHFCGRWGERHPWDEGTFDKLCQHCLEA